MGQGAKPRWFVVGHNGEGYTAEVEYSTGPRALFQYKDSLSRYGNPHTRKDSHETILS